MASQSTSLTIVYSTVYSRRRSKKTPKLRITGLRAGNSLVTSPHKGPVTRIKGIILFVYFYCWGNYISCIIPYFKGTILHNQWWIIQIVEVIVWQMVNIFFITLAVRFRTVPDLFQLKGNKADNYITCYSLHKTRTICVAQCQNLDVNLRCIVQQILSYTGNSDQMWFITGESNLANNLDYHRNSVAARQDVGSSGYGLVNIAYHLSVLSNNDFLTTKSGVLWYTPVVYASIV